MPIQFKIDSNFNAEYFFEFTFSGHDSTISPTENHVSDLISLFYEIINLHANTKCSSSNARIHTSVNYYRECWIEKGRECRRETQTESLQPKCRNKQTGRIHKQMYYVELNWTESNWSQKENWESTHKHRLFIIYTAGSLSLSPLMLLLVSLLWIRSIWKLVYNLDTCHALAYVDTSICEMCSFFWGNFRVELKVSKYS